MIKIQMITIFIMVASCAAFVKVSEKKNTSYLHLKNVAVKMKIIENINNKMIINVPPEELLMEVNRSKGCDLGMSGNLMRNVARIHSGYSFRIFCDVISALKQSGGDIELVENDRKVTKKAILNLEILVDHNFSTSETVFEVLNIASLGIIPYWNTKKYVTKGAYESLKGKKISFTFNEKLIDVRQLLLLPVMPFFKSTYLGAKQIHENIANGIIKQLGR